MLTQDDAGSGNAPGQGAPLETGQTAKATPGSGPRLDSALGIILGVLGFLIGARVISDNSFLTHFTTGDLIRTSGAVPTTDPYSYTAAGEAWTVQSWFASLTYSWTNQIAGGTGLRVLNGVLTATLVAAVWKLTDRCHSLIARLVTCGVVVTIGATMWTPRPLLFGLVGIAAVMLVLDRRIAPFWLIPALWVWVNSHGSFPLAGVLVCTAAVGAWMDSRRVPRHELTVLAWTVGGLALGAINPLGPKLLWFPVQLLGKRDALEGVAEWARPQFDRPVDWLFAVMIAALAYAMVRRVPWVLSVPAVLFVVAGFSASRNIGLAAIVMAPAVGLGLGSLPSSIDGAERSPIARLLAAAGVAGGVMALLLVVSGGALNLERYPVEAVDYMIEHDLAGSEDDQILNRDTVGNYMHYRLGLDARVFVDDRFDFYPADVLSDHLDLVKADDGVDLAAIVQRRDPTAIIWHAESPLGEWLLASTEWDVRYQDENYLVAVPG